MNDETTNMNTNLEQVLTDDEEDIFVARLVSGFFIGAAALGLLCGLETQVTKVVKIYVAPKVYLVEFTTKLVK